MISLEHRVPPPAIALLCALLAWLLARATPELAYSMPGRLSLAIIFVLAGLSLDISGLLAFRKAKTTINPLSPRKSSAIVQTGLYRWTRNPMYLGMALVLVGWSVYLANPLALLGVVAFVGYITRFQIVPEERLLLAKFGEPYAQYMKSVRRWF